MGTFCNLDKYERGKLVEDNKYEGMIKSIIYLIVYCLDIDMCLYARFQGSSKESHLFVS